ncbi:MAG: hypothetical protein V4563_14060 [Pseudomonadota bacterium]
MSAEDTPIVAGRRIAVSPTGSHALPWTPRQRPDGIIPPNQISLWTTAEDFTVQDLDWPTPFSQPETVFVGDRLLISDVPGSVGPVQVREYDATTLALITQSQFGDGNSRIGCSCPVDGGGAVFINFVTFGLNSPTYCFDLAYRQDLPPGLPNAPIWVTKRLTFPNSDLGTYISPMDCVEVGGIVYLFHGFDGSGRWDLLMVDLAKMVAGEPEFYLHVPFLGRSSGALSPCVEIPFITASLDKAGNRILLAYQGVDQVDTKCPGGAGQLAYPTLLVAMDLGTRVPTLLKHLPWDCFHDLAYSPVPMWARPDGIYFPSIKRTNCDTSLALYRLELSGAITQLFDAAPGAIVRSCSSDGWTAIQPADGGPWSVERIKAVPKLAVRDLGDNTVRVSWDYNLPTDILEASPILPATQWTTQASGPGPVVVPKNEQQQFFRLKRG